MIVRRWRGVSVVGRVRFGEHRGSDWRDWLGGRGLRRLGEGLVFGWCRLMGVWWSYLRGRCVRLQL